MAMSRTSVQMAPQFLEHSISKVRAFGDQLLQILALGYLLRITGAVLDQERAQLVMFNRVLERISHQADNVSDAVVVEREVYQGFVKIVQRELTQLWYIILVRQDVEFGVAEENLSVDFATLLVRATQTAHRRCKNVFRICDEFSDHGLYWRV